MPQRYNWIQRRSRNAAGSTADSSSSTDAGTAASSRTHLIISSPNKGSMNPNLDLSAALVPPSRDDGNDDLPNERQDSLSPTYLVASCRSSMNSQKSPSFRNQHRHINDEDEEGSSIYFISEPSLSEDCRSVENSTSPTNDLYPDHGAEGIIRPYFSPMQLVRRRASKLIESPTSGHDSLQDSSIDDFTSSGLKLHTIHSPASERESNSSSDHELERILPSDRKFHDDVDVDVNYIGADGRAQQYALKTSHRQVACNSDEIPTSENADAGEPTQMIIRSNFGSYSSSRPSDGKKGDKFNWKISKNESPDESRILHPTAVRNALHLEQPLNTSVLPQVSSNERIGMTQSISDPFKTSSSNWVKANAAGTIVNSTNHLATLPSVNTPDSDSSSLSSPAESAYSRSSSPFSWISNKKNINQPVTVDESDRPFIQGQDSGEVEKFPLILSSSEKVHMNDIPNEKSTRRNFPRHSTVTNFSFFETEVSGDEAKRFPTFVCPRCKTRQREFFTVATVPGQFESPAGYLAIYFAIYVVASLYIFGLEVKVFCSTLFDLLSTFLSLMSNEHRGISLQSI